MCFLLQLSDVLPDEHRFDTLVLVSGDKHVLHMQHMLHMYSTCICTCTVHAHVQHVLQMMTMKWHCSHSSLKLFWLLPCPVVHSQQL